MQGNMTPVPSLPNSYYDYISACKPGCSDDPNCRYKNLPTLADDLKERAVLKKAAVDAKKAEIQMK